MEVDKVHLLTAKFTHWWSITQIVTWNLIHYAHLILAEYTKVNTRACAQLKVFYLTKTYEPEPCRFKSAN